MKIFPFVLFGPLDAGCRQVNSRDIVTFCRKDPGMSSSAAAHVEHARTRRRLEPIQQMGDEYGRLPVISFKIKLVIVRRIEPFAEPIGSYSHAGQSFNEIMLIFNIL